MVHPRIDIDKFLAIQFCKFSDIDQYRSRDEVFQIERNSLDEREGEVI